MPIYGLGECSGVVAEARALVGDAVYYRARAAAAGHESRARA